MYFYNNDILMPYQKTTLAIAIEDFLTKSNSDNQRRVVVAPTGSGKTFMMLAFIEKNIDLDEYDNLRFVVITHSLQMAKGFQEDIKKLRTSIYTFEDLENKIHRLNDKVLLLNPEKISTDAGKDFLNRWVRHNKGKNVILLMDEADVTHDGKRNSELLDIIKPTHELGFTATFDSKNDKKKAKQSNRQPSKLLHEVSLNDVREAEMLVKGFEFIADTEGVSLESIIDTAVDKQLEIFNKTKDMEDGYIPRILIQTNASNALEVKELVYAILKTKKTKLYFENDYQAVGVLTADIKDFSEDEKDQYLVVIGDGIVSRGWDFPEVKILVVDKNSVDERVGVQLLGRAARMPNQYYRDNDLLNNGYIYVAGKHSIEKSGELYSAGIVIDNGQNNHTILEKEEFLPRFIEMPEFMTTINAFSDNFDLDSDEYEDRLDALIAIVQGMIDDSTSKDSYKKEIILDDFSGGKGSRGLIELEVDERYALTKVKKTLFKSIPKILVQDAFSEKELRSNIKYQNIFESLIDIIERDPENELIDLVEKLKLKKVPFEFGKRSISKAKATEYKRSLYPFDDSLNNEESELAAFIDEYCEQENKYWIRNIERKDIRLAIGYYPDFIIFDGDGYFMIEYKGAHLIDSNNSSKKKEFGLNSETPVLMVIKQGEFKVAKSIHDSYVSFTRENVNRLLRKLK